MLGPLPLVFLRRYAKSAVTCDALVQNGAKVITSQIRTCIGNPISSWLFSVKSTLGQECVNWHVAFLRWYLLLVWFRTRMISGGLVLLYIVGGQKSFERCLGNERAMWSPVKANSTVQYSSWTRIVAFFVKKCMRPSRVKIYTMLSPRAPV
ncbi:hypothetical protein BJV78DRAFT_1218551 [Lactifluus subvellereus]|nr:hypothetical protein BJV78DRAFT_1218551 [Lactifluus subvellereus]